MWTDTHAHLDHDQYALDRDAVIDRAWNNDVHRVINVGFDRATIEATMRLVEAYDWIDAAIGWHPLEVHTVGEEHMDWIAQLVRTCGRIVAIGEIGLDYSRPDAPKALQQQWFRTQIALARQLRVPIVIHNRDAHADTIHIMEQCHAYDVGGVMHCFGGSWEMARICIEMGFSLSFGGPITYKNAKTPKEVLARLPEDRWMLETDAPYLAPHPFRGTRNESAHIAIIGEAAATLRCVDVPTAARIATQNAHRVLPRRTV
jgi:TatD DNase family protein